MLMHILYDLISVYLCGNNFSSAFYNVTKAAVSVQVGSFTGIFCSCVGRECYLQHASKVQNYLLLSTYPFESLSSPVSLTISILNNIHVCLILGS